MKPPNRQPDAEIPKAKMRFWFNEMICQTGEICDPMQWEDYGKSLVVLVGTSQYGVPIMRGHITNCNVLIAYINWLDERIRQC